MENLENNKLMAKFMGVTVVSDIYVSEVTNAFGLGTSTLILLGYDTDWNRLMEVVEKINNLSIQGSPEIRICKYFTEAFYNPIINYIEERKYSVFHTDGMSKIETVYGCCLEFIKWYNQQPK